MTGGLISKGLAPYLDAKWLILLAAVVLFGVVALVQHIHSRFPSNVVAKIGDGKKKTGFFAPLKNNYALTLLLISMTGALSGLLIDFQFYAAAASASMGSKGNANFFANFYILLNFSSLLLQLFATPKIQDKIGIRGGLMVLPFALIGGASFRDCGSHGFQSLGAARHRRRFALLRPSLDLGAGIYSRRLDRPLGGQDRRRRHRRAHRRSDVAACALLLWVKKSCREAWFQALDTRWMFWDVVHSRHVAIHHSRT